MLNIDVGQGWQQTPSELAQSDASEPTIDVSTETAPSTADTSTGQGSDDSDYSLASGFLNNVPEDQRSIVEPYVKKWDAGVTRRFQELHSSYAPYKQFMDQGVDASEIESAMQVYQLLDTNPQYLYQLLKTELDGEQGQPSSEQLDDNDDDIPVAVQQQLEKQQQMLEALAAHLLGQEQQSTAAQQDAELDDYLGLLTDEFGDYDEDFVLTKMARGMSGEDAVKAYFKLIDKQLEARDKSGQGSGSTAPPILSGGGVAGSSSKTVSNASDKEVRELVANMLKNSSNS